MNTVWDEAAQDGQELTNKDDKNKMNSLFMASRSPDPAESLIANSSGYVRGYIHVSGYWIKPLSTSSEGDGSCTDCKLTLAAHTELGGSIPSSIINVLSSTAPMKLLSTVKEIMKKHNITKRPSSNSM